MGNAGDETDSVCASDVSAVGTDLEVLCGSVITGRYVTLSSDTWMVLCEMKVYAEAADANIALNKPATQSSDLHTGEGPASKGVDGNPDTNFHTHGAGCTHTWLKGGGSLNPWWQVDLQQSTTVATVRVTNRRVPPHTPHAAVHVTLLYTFAGATAVGRAWIPSPSK